jgi:perosamine synthetase
MPNLNAAVGCAQLESIESKLSIKRELHLRYQKAFANIRGIKLIAEPTNCHSNYWLQTLLLDKEFADQRNLILDMTNKAEIITRPAWEIIKSLTPYMNSPSAELDSTSSLAGRIINIPSSPSLIGRNE